MNDTSNALLTTITTPQLATRVPPAPPGDANRYRAILERAVGEGARRVARVIETVRRDVPNDLIVPMRVARFEADDNAPLRVVIGGDGYEPSSFAVGQIATRAGVPLPYLRELLAGDAAPWKRGLAADILTRHHANGGAGRILARCVGRQLRGWLSDRFRRLDCRPLLDALAGEAERLGALPIDAVATETRVAVKVVMPDILEPLPGEFVVHGCEWSNSDFGNGAHEFRVFVLRVACLNGMTTTDVLRQVHLGTRLGDDFAFSERTYRHDTATSASALRDVVHVSLGPKGRDKTIDMIRRAHERGMTVQQLAQATRSLTKSAQKSITDAFESADVINLPAGHTAWRASNAVSWVARHTEDAEQRLDLERVAGTLA